MAAPLVVYYVSAHGFGHATRAAAVCREIERLGARLLIRTEAPAWLFSEEGVEAPVSAAGIDLGLAMKDALSVDIPASLASYEAQLAGWDERRENEARFLKENGADVVLSDAEALPLEAAKDAGVPSAVVSNFTWDWIVEPWGQEDPRWKSVFERLSEAYRTAGILLRLPLGGGVPNVVRQADMPLVVRRPERTRADVLRELGLDPEDSRPVAAYSFGGVDWRGGRAPAADALEDWRFIAYVPRPQGVKAEWKELPRRSGLRHCDVMAAADAVLMKPGYGTFAEALASRVPALVVPRADFRETPPMLAAVGRIARLRLLTREDFFAGRWAAGLSELRSSRQPWADIAMDGAETVARRTLDLAEARRDRR